MPRVSLVQEHVGNTVSSVWVCQRSNNSDLEFPCSHPENQYETRNIEYSLTGTVPQRQKDAGSEMQEEASFAIFCLSLTSRNINLSTIQRKRLQALHHSIVFIENLQREHGGSIDGKELPCVNFKAVSV